MTNVAIVFIVGIGTYLIRLSFVAAVGRKTMPEWALVPLRFVAPAVLAALVAPAVLLHNGGFDLAPSTNPRALAALIAILIAWKTKNTALVIVAGMSVVWFLQAVA